MKKLAAGALALSLLAVSGWAATDIVVLEETFDSASVASNFDEVFDVDGTGSPETNYALEYSTYTIDTTDITIPEAPNTPTGAVATTGAFLQVNSNPPAEEPMVLSIYPNNVTPLTGAHTLTVDLFFIIASPGTTEHLSVGILHAGDKALNYSQDEDNFPAESVSTDGYAGYMSAEGGAANDIAFLEGDPAAIDVSLPADGSTGFNWALDPMGTESRSNFAGNEIESIFTDSGLFGTLNSGEADGPNESWVTMRVSIDASGVVTWSMDIHDGNGFTTLCTYDDPDDTYTSGVPSVGLADLFGSANDFGGLIVDNLVITKPGSSAENWNLYK